MQVSAAVMESLAPLVLDSEVESKKEEEEKKPDAPEGGDAAAQTEEPKPAEEEEEKIEYGPIKIVLKDGTCECFGAELVPNKEYVFNPGMIFALFTWTGCKLSITGGSFKHSL